MPWYGAAFSHYPVASLPAPQYHALQSRTAWPVRSKGDRVNIFHASSMSLPHLGQGTFFGGFMPPQARLRLCCICTHLRCPHLPKLHTD